MLTEFDSEPIHIFDLLPHLLRFKGKRLLVKYGGNAMLDPELKLSVIRDVVFLKLINLKPVIVHGGGPEIDTQMDRVGLEPDFVEGHRKTDRDTLEVVEMVLTGKINSELVKLINMEGVRAAGLSGKDGALVTARKHHRTIEKEGKASTIDLGHVGEVVRIDPTLIDLMIDHDHVPVVSPIAVGTDGQDYNINADVLAGELAATLKVEELVFLTDVDGLRRDPEDESSLIRDMDQDQLRKLVAAGGVRGGMIPKVDAALTALDGGVNRIHMVNGTLPHSMLTTLLTEHGCGTRIERTKEREA